MTPEDGFEPARRELCPDGSCIGLIGPDGRCKVCGTVSPSAVADPRRQGMVDGTDGAADDEEDDRELCPDGACVGVIGADGRCGECGRGREVAAVQPPVNAIVVDGDESERELCPDGGCIGLIGPSGRCKVCGLARGAASP